jgi:hypothetical protein
MSKKDDDKEKLIKFINDNELINYSIVQKKNVGNSYATNYINATFKLNDDDKKDDDKKEIKSYHILLYVLALIFILFIFIIILTNIAKL